MWQFPAAGKPRINQQRIPAGCSRAIAVLASCLALLRAAPAQDSWEFSPYRIHVWLALEDVPELPPSLWPVLERSLRDQLEASYGATWEAQVHPAPARFRSELLYRLDQFPVDDLVTAAKLGKSGAPPKVPGPSSAPPSSSRSDSAAPPAAGAPAASPSATPMPATEPPPAGGPVPSPPTPAAPAPAAEATSPPAAGCDPMPGESPGAGEAAPAGPAEPATAETPAAAPGAGPTDTTADSAPAAPPATPATDASGGAAAPPAAGKSGAADEGEPPVDPLVTHLREIFAGDKLLIANVRVTLSGWSVQVRELDIRARRWTAVLELAASDIELLPRVVAEGLQQVFLPITRIDYAKDKTVMVRLRAGGLAVRAEEPVMLGEQALLRPWVRHNDRYGEPRPPLGVQTIPFSYLVVKQREGSRLECDVHTGVRFPITGRNNSRTQRFALAVRPTQATTLVRLRTNEKPPQPLSGYDVYAKDPHSEKIELIGRTDWRGTMELPPSPDFPLRVVYVKNGGSLLARLPTVPGVEAEMVVDLTPDDRRLQAEGFVAGVQAVLTDLVAQRELYTKRIRARLTEGKVGDAEKLLEEFKALPTRDDVQKLLDQQQPRITSPHKKVQAKIDKQFEDTRKLLYKFVDPGLVGKLEDDVKQTREGKGPYAATSSALDRVLTSPAPPPTPAAPSAPAPNPAPGGSPMPGGPPMPMPMPMPMP